MNKESIKGALIASAAVFALAGTAMTSGACKKSDETASADGGDGGASTVVTNASDVTRYPDETKMANVVVTVVRDTGATIHKSPPNGDAVATLPKGASVTEIAELGHAFLVTFDDPADAKHKMGWINEDAFDNNVPPEAGAGFVGHGHVVGAGHDGGVAATVSGGSTSNASTAGQIMVPANGNACPAGFTKDTHDANCRRSCTTNHDCPAGSCKSKVCTIG